MTPEKQSQPIPVTTDTKRSFGLDQPLFRAAIGVALLILVVLCIWPVQAMSLSHEGGPFESISAAALVLAGGIALFRYRGISRLYIGLVCLLLAERELAADIYAVDSLPYGILNGLDTLLDMNAVRVILAVLALGGLLWHGVPNGWRAFKQRVPFLMVFFLAGMCAVVAQGLEEVSGALKDDLSDQMIMRLFVLEETLEMFFSIGILASVLIGWPKATTEENLNDQQSDQS
ncbi:hypothetical protein [Ruegeria faecimaris]|uniref:Uncharacterized protein n=1 Tax=Ruegeria faecimaris TaxID=686389 RepID=A0A521AAX8_9RHOB|nr:hypothetical protein [Ruegeria faecimaris]SMO31969.1 hypothetical protein SAMN06265380_1016 [Ruegeria faecimaris]